MVKIRILGGEADSNGVAFYSYKYKAISEYKDNNLNIKVESHKMAQKNKFTTTQFIRGLYHFIFNRISNGEKIRIKITLFNIIGIILYVLDKFIFNISLMDYAFISYIFIACVIGSLSKNMTQFHGAEHMVDNYYYKYNKISLDDIEAVKKCSVVHDRCGTNLLGIQLIILLLLKLVIDDFMIRYFLMISIVHEISINRTDYKIIYYLTYPLYAVGMLIQRIFFVRQPKDSDIEIAIKTVQELEKYENDKEKQD